MPHQRGRRALSKRELAQQAGGELPNREQTSLVDLNAAVPVHAAVALHALSDG